nr:hypothetical protein [Eubacterium sp.]
MGNRAIQKYIRQVKVTYRGDRKVKQQFISDLQDALLCYYESHPDCSYTDLTEKFGAPKEFRDSFSTLLPSSLKKRNMFVSSLIILVAVLMMIAVVLFSIFYVRESHNHTKGYYLEYQEKKTQPQTTAVPSTSEPTPIMEHTFD